MKARPAVFLVGLGQLGSRYLQGLANVSFPLRIFASDPSTSSLENAEKRWIEAGGNDADHELVATAGPEQFPKEASLCIVATNADVRTAVVRRVSERRTIRHWILEKVLAQSPAQIDAIGRLLEKADGVWINQPRRAMDWYQNIRNLFDANQTYRFEASGGIWGMACNAVHYLDLIGWLTRESLEALTTEGLDPVWIDAKRKGFREITGKMFARYSGGSELTLESRPQKTGFNLLFTSEENEGYIDEKGGIAESKGEKRNGKVFGRIELQSEITSRIVQQILCEGKCDLTPFEDSAKLHKAMLCSLLEHWNTSQKRHERILPIT